MVSFRKMRWLDGFNALLSGPACPGCLAVPFFAALNRDVGMRKSNALQQRLLLLRVPNKSCNNDRSHCYAPSSWPLEGCVSPQNR